MSDLTDLPERMQMLMELTAAVRIAHAIRDAGPVTPLPVRRELAGTIVSWSEDIADRFESEIEPAEMEDIRRSLDKMNIALMEFDLKEDDTDTEDEDT